MNGECLQYVSSLHLFFKQTNADLPYVFVFNILGFILLLVYSLLNSYNTFDDWWYL